MTNRLLIDTSGSGILRVSRPGVDVFSAADHDLILSETFSTSPAKIIASGIYSGPTGESKPRRVSFLNPLNLKPRSVMVNSVGSEDTTGSPVLTIWEVGLTYFDVTSLSATATNVIWKFIVWGDGG